jgi:hypothetical protein
MVYDFLYEYVAGNEELGTGKLVNVVRLMESPTRERKVQDYLGTRPGRFAKVKTGYKMYIDRLEVNSNTTIIAGSVITITLTYSPVSYIHGNKRIMFMCDTLLQSSDGFTITLQNKLIPLSRAGTNLVVVVVAYEDGVPLTSPQTFSIPIIAMADSTYYYGCGAPGLSVAQIQALSTTFGPKASKTLEFTSTEQVQYFASPVSFGNLTSIKDQNEFDITEDFVKTVRAFTVSGLTSNYNVYEFVNINTVSNFDITFNF